MQISATRRQLMLSLAALPLAAKAQDFPNKLIRFVVAFPPGSATDTSARYFGSKITELTGAPVIVDNRPGANSIIAIRAVLSAPNDGYTIFIGSNSPLAVNPVAMKSLPYDPVKDFRHLSLLTRVPAVLVVPKDSPYKTLKDLVDAAKAKPGKLNFAYGSTGYQFMGELFNEHAKVSTIGVPFKSAGESVTAVAAGTVDFSFAEISSTLELVKGGRIRPLMIATDKRSPALPEVPTSAQAGIGNMTAYAWVAALASANVDKAAAAKLEELFKKILAMPETHQFYERIGGEITAGGGAELKKFQTDELALWKRVATTARIEPQ